MKRKNLNKKIRNIFLVFSFLLLFPTIVYAHDHTENCYGGNLHTCQGDETNGGACYTEQANEDGTKTYVKTCGKTSGRYYNSAGQYLMPQCNKIGVGIEPVEPVQQTNNPNFKINVTFLDGHTEQVQASRTDWNSSKYYGSDGVITVYWNGLVNSALTPGEISAQIKFTSPPTPTPTQTPIPTQEPTATPIQITETPTPTEELPIENETTPEIEPPQIEETPIPTIEPTINTPLPTITVAPTQSANVEPITPIVYDEEILTSTPTNTPTPTFVPIKEPVEISKYIPVVVVAICIFIAFGFIIWYNIKKKKNNTPTQMVDLNNFIYKD